MKKKLIIVFTILLIAIVVLYILSDKSLSKDRARVEKVINSKYSSYKIKDIKLEYVDWSATIKEADENNRATMSTVIVENEQEQETIHLERTFNIWYIKSAYPNYGPNVPNGEYFAKVEYTKVGIETNIDEYIKDYWVVKNSNGDLYTKEEYDKIKYYSFKEYKKIYKTKNGKVYETDKERLKWEESTVTYNDLCYYDSYNYLKKEEAKEILEKYGL